MVGASLNHCKKMGAEPGRRFLKQPTAKLEPVIAELSQLALRMSSWLTLLDSCVAIGNPERHLRKASHRGSKQQ